MPSHVGFYLGQCSFQSQLNLNIRNKWSWLCFSLRHVQPWGRSGLEILGHIVVIGPFPFLSTTILSEIGQRTLPIVPCYLEGLRIFYNLASELCRVVRMIINCKPSNWLRIKRIQTLLPIKSSFGDQFCPFLFWLIKYKFWLLSLIYLPFISENSKCCLYENLKMKEIVVWKYDF